MSDQRSFWGMWELTSIGQPRKDAKSGLVDPSTQQREAEVQGQLGLHESPGSRVWGEDGSGTRLWTLRRSQQQLGNET